MIRSHFGVLAIAATVVLTGCGEDKKAQSPATLAIAIGSAAPLTGGIAHLGKDNENGARLAVDDATAYGEGLANEVEKTLKAAGVKVLAREKGTDKTTDWKAALTKVKGRNPDAVFYGGMDATAGPLLKQGRELGIKGVFAFGDGACTENMKQLAGEAAEGLLCSQA